MIFHETDLAGAYVIDLEKREDERGFFARTYCERELETVHPGARVVQANCSFNHKAGTLRGMHLQRPPHAEIKLVRVTRGSIYDVIVDLRPGSKTFGRWIGVELSAENRRTLLVPEGFGHGFQTLEDASEVAYQVTAFYTPGAEMGLRWDDPALDIKWPLPVSCISEKDAAWPDFDPARFEESLAS